MLPTVPFTDALKDVSSGNVKIPQGEFLSDGQLAVVDQGQSLVAGFTDDRKAAVRSPAPLIVFGDHTRAIKFIDFPFAMGADGVKVLQVRDGFDPKFVYHYLRSRPIPSAGYSRHFKFLKEVVVPKPPLPEQRRIAAILDHADALRIKRRQVLTHLDALVQAVFHQMFDTQCDRVPFATACERVTVGVVVKPASHYVEVGVPALRTLNVKPGRIVLGDLVYFSEASNNGPLAKSRLRVGDLVIARTGKAGTTAIVPPQLDGANAIDLIVATPNTEVASPIYLEALLNSETGKRIVSGETRGQIQQHFNVGSLKSASVPMPPLPLQMRFAERVERVNAQRGAYEQAIAADDELFAALQARAFRGEL